MSRKKKRAGAELTETETETPRKKARGSCRAESLSVVDDLGKPPPSPAEASSKPGPSQKEPRPKGPTLTYFKANESKAKLGVEFV